MKTNNINEQQNGISDKQKNEPAISKILRTIALKVGSILIKLGDLDPTNEYKNDFSTDMSPIVNTTIVKNEGIHTIGHESDVDKDFTTDNSTNNHGQISAYILVHKAKDLINDYDRCAEDSENDTLRALYNDASNKIIENLILSGCTAINPEENDLYDFAYHITRPIMISTDRLIQRTVRLGVMIGDEVLIKAIVELK